MKPKFNNTRDKFVFYAEKRTNDILGRIIEIEARFGKGGG